MSEFRVKKISNQVGSAPPDVDTAAPGDSSKKVANTEFVTTAISETSQILIDDTTPAADKTYSSQRVETKLSAQSGIIDGLKPKVYFMGGF